MKRVIALFLIFLLLMTVVACKPDKSKVENKNENPATAEVTLEGSGEGLNGPIKVRVTLKGPAIEKVEVLEHKETQGIADAALKTIPEGIVTHQSLKVDAIAGATYTSKGIVAAVTDALKVGKVDVAPFEKAIDKGSDKKEAVELRADVVIVGGGGAGLAAAVSALDNKASVILVEKMPVLGGSTVMAGGQYNASDAKRQEKQTLREGLIQQAKDLASEIALSEDHRQLMETVNQQIKEYEEKGSTYLFDSPELHALHTFKGGDQKGDLKLIQTLTRGAADSIEWLEKLNVEFKDEIATVTGALWPRTHQFVKPLVTGPIDAYKEKIQANDKAQVLMETTATQILMDQGKAVGVKASQKGKEYTLYANKGVIIATGGFAKNKELITKYNTHWPDLSNLGSTNAVGATGEGILMAEAAGANLVGMEYIQLLPVGHPKTGGMQGNISINAANQIFVNKEGKRFVAEDARRDTLTLALLEQPDQMMWILHDAHEYHDENVKNDFNETIGELVANKTAVKGETLEELAKNMNIDPAVLKETIEDYNKSVRGEQEDSLGKKLLQDSFDKGPFYASVRVPTIHHTMGGIQINEKAQVLGSDGNVIPGLFAAGEVTGGIHGANRLGGNALPDTVVFGKIAGETAAKQ